MQAVAALAFSPDGKTLVSGGRDGEARLWHLPSSK
jgi:WD40 repeat protein